MSYLNQITPHLESAIGQKDCRCEDDEDDEDGCFVEQRYHISNSLSQKPPTTSNAIFSSASSQRPNLENYIRAYLNDTNRFLKEVYRGNPLSSHISTGAIGLQSQNYHQFPHGQIGLDTKAQTGEINSNVQITNVIPLTTGELAIQAAPTASYAAPLLPSVYNLQNHIQNATLVTQHCTDYRENKSEETLESSTAENIDIFTPRSVLEHWKTRPFVPLGTPDDSVWLSDFNHFLRAECLEVFTATVEDVVGRRKAQKIVVGQVGIRCRFCAHLPPEQRLNCACIFPLKTTTIYQRVITMVKYHFPKCLEMPSDVRVNYITLKGRRSKGNIRHGKQHWETSAAVIGIEDGIDGGLFMSPRLPSLYTRKSK